MPAPLELRAQLAEQALRDLVFLISRANSLAAIKEIGHQAGAEYDAAVARLDDELPEAPPAKPEARFAASRHH